MPHSIVIVTVIRNTRDRGSLSLLAVAFALLTSPALASDLNSFRAEHKLPPLAYSVTLAVAAQEHARDMARRNTLDHKNFRERIGPISGGASAENVAMVTCARPDAKPVPTFAGRADGCPDQPCVIKMWAKSPGHFSLPISAKADMGCANMLRRDVSAYGIASADADDGRRYWVLELGN